MKNREWIRVAKSEIKKPSMLESKGLEMCLECWKSYRLLPEGEARAKYVKSLKGNPDDYQKDPKETPQDKQNRVGAVTQTLVHSLPGDYWKAIYSHCGLDAKIKSPIPAFQRTLKDALKLLEIKLRSNTCTASLF